MKTVTLGRTGLEVSQIGLGGIPIIAVDRDESIDLIRYCFDRGINFYDTANMYDDSEEKYGAGLEPIRDKVIIATKTGAKDVDTAAEHLALSLERLRTDYIDLYQIHNLSKDEHFEQIMGPGLVMDFLEEKQKEGVIRHLGVTAHNPDVALRAVETDRFSTLQFPFNFVEYEPQKKLFDGARKLNMGLIAMKPLGGGLLEKARLCFGFLQQHPDVVPIPGIKDRAELDEIIGLYENPRPLNDEELAEIAQIQEKLGVRFCHRCGYCTPCPQGIEIPFALMIPSAVARSTKERLETVFGPKADQVEDCIECGECVEKCPYDLPIPEMLKECRDLYLKTMGRG